MCQSSILVSYMNFFITFVVQKKILPPFLLQVEAVLLFPSGYPPPTLMQCLRTLFHSTNCFDVSVCPPKITYHWLHTTLLFSLLLSPFLFHAPHNPNNFSWSHWFYYDSTTPTRHPSQPLRPDSPTQSHPPHTYSQKIVQSTCLPRLTLPGSVGGGEWLTVIQDRRNYEHWSQYFLSPSNGPLDVFNVEECTW